MDFEEKDRQIRLDKYLWAIRIFKTRSLASEAIGGGKVKLNGESLKVSKKVKMGDIFEIRRDQLKIKIEVTGLIDKRVSAEKARENYNLLESSTMDISKLKSVFFKTTIHRDKGSGRPTKKDRREIDRRIL